MALFSSKNGLNAASCAVHGGHARKANLTLIAMIAAGFGLIVWHVSVFGTSAHGHAEVRPDATFLQTLGAELWDLLIDKHGILAELWDIFPYFIAGVLLAGWIRTYKFAVKLQLSLRKYGITSVFLASFIGIITPLCACGTLTTAISLLFAGIPLAPVMALLVTSPLMSPSTYLLTLNDLGTDWTVIRTLAALLMGIFAGLVTHFLKKRGFETKQVFIDGAIFRGDFHDEDYPDERLRCGCRQKFGNRVALKTSNKFIIFLAKSSEMLWLVGKYVIAGVIIGAIVERYIPSEWIYRFFGRKDPFNILWVTLASVPVFLHQISASSILFHIKSSLNGTLDSGAALAFMIGGPVTAMPTLVMFWTIFRKRVFVLYMTICLVGTILITLSLQALFFVPGIDTGNPLFRGVSSLSGGNSAVISKKGDSARIAMDPDDKPLVATYSNMPGKEGGAVFDAGGTKFRAENIAKFDNSRYIANIADWLEQNNSGNAKESILALDLSSRSGSMDGKLLLQAATSTGRQLRFAERAELPALTAGLLEKQSQLWLFIGKESELSPHELEAVAAFSANGGSLLIVATEGTINETLNSVSAPFGICFTGTSVQKPQIKVAVAAPAFYRAAEIIGSMLKFTHKA